MVAEKSDKMEINNETGVTLTAYVQCQDVPQLLIANGLFLKLFNKLFERLLPGLDLFAQEMFYLAAVKSAV